MYKPTYHSCHLRTPCRNKAGVPALECCYYSENSGGFILHQLDICIKLLSSSHAILLILYSFIPFLFYLFFHYNFLFSSSWRSQVPVCNRCGTLQHDILFEWQDLGAGTICYSADIEHPVEKQTHSSTAWRWTSQSCHQELLCHITQAVQGIRLIFRLLKSSLLNLRCQWCPSWSLHNLLDCTQDSQVQGNEINALFSIVNIWKHTGIILLSSR